MFDSQISRNGAELSVDDLTKINVPMPQAVLDILEPGAIAICAKFEEVCERIADLRELDGGERDDQAIAAGCELAAQTVVAAFMRIMKLRPSYPMAAAWHMVALQVQQRGIATIEGLVGVMAASDEATHQ